jgi:predicted MFS family arabinose efflux permease
MVSMRLCDAMLPALGTSFAVPAAEASATISAFAIAYGLVQLVYGPLGDRFGKPRVIAFATLACGAGAFSASMSQSLGALVASRALMGGAAGAIIPLTMAWIGDEVPWEGRQLVLAKLLTYTVTGLMVGAAAGGAVAETVGWRWAFVAVGVLFIAVGGAVWLRSRRLPMLPGASHASHAGQLRSLLADPWARRVFAVTFAEGALVFGLIAFVPTVLHNRFAMPLSAAGGVLALFGMGGVLYSRSARPLLAWLPAPRLAIAGGACLCAAFITLAAMPHWAWSLAACLIAGLGFYMMHNTLQTCATQLSPSARGTAVSLFACVLFIGQSVGVFAVAELTNTYAPAVCFAAAGPALLMLAIYFAYRMRSAVSAIS